LFQLCGSGGALHRDHNSDLPIHRLSAATFSSPYPDGRYGMSDMLRFESVYKAYEQNLVLQNINLTVPEHTVTCLIGASGCGKSTLLRCTNLLESIQHG